MTALHYIDISETVNNQHAKDCGCDTPSPIKDEM